MTIPALSPHTKLEMSARVAKVLNLLGADSDLLNTADADVLLELIEDYLNEPEDNQGSPTHLIIEYNVIT